MPDPRDDQPTLGELGRRLDEYARTTGAALDKLENKIDAMGDNYVTRREYDRDDADHEQAHRDFATKIEAVRAEAAAATNQVRSDLAAAEKRTTESKRWAVGAIISALALLIAVITLLRSFT